MGHECSNRTEAYLELYDQQNANRIAAGPGVGNLATGLPKQRETTFGLGGRQALNQAKTLNLLRVAQRLEGDSSLTLLVNNAGTSVMGAFAEAKAGVIAARSCSFVRPDSARTVPTTFQPFFKNSCAIARPRPREAAMKRIVRGVCSGEFVGMYYSSSVHCLSIMGRFRSKRQTHETQ